MTAGLDTERLAVLVHEVRSPVAALSAIAEAIVDETIDAATHVELVRLAISAARSVERVVADVAVASIRYEEVVPEQLVDDAVAAAILGGACVEGTVDADLPRIQGDPQRLRQALDNLIENGVEHSGSTGVVVVSARVDDGLTITVSDAGIGIPVEERERIFDVGVSLESGAGGSGIGLALTRAIVEGHGGTLTVTSEPGEGATFTIVLPIHG